MVRWEDQNTDLGKMPGGNYATPNTVNALNTNNISKPTNLGINPIKETVTGEKVNKVPNKYITKEKTRVLKSTAK